MIFWAKKCDFSGNVSFVCENRYFLNFLNHLKFNSSKIEAKLKELHNFEDEELIVGLAQIYYDVKAILIKIHSGNIAAALSSIDELKEKFQDSIKATLRII